MFRIALKLSFIFLTLLVACRAPKIPCKPHVSYCPPLCCLKDRPCPFKALTTEELKEEWGKELKIGYAFAKEHDFYRAITAFKRGLILCPCKERSLEMEYGILLSYYLAEKYEDVICAFKESHLKNCLSPTFPALHDLLVILYDTYSHVDDKKCAEALLPYLHQICPKTEKELVVSAAIREGQMDKAIQMEGSPPYLCPLYNSYTASLKSVKTASALNAMLPGAGYWYVGQKNTAITALIINSLFVAAAYQFFHKGYIAAGLFTTSLEAGWYLGGIYGAARAANEFNEHQYDTWGRKALDQAALYPTLMLNFTF